MQDGEYYVPKVFGHKEAVRTSAFDVVAVEKAAPNKEPPSRSIPHPSPEDLHRHHFCYGVPVSEPHGFVHPLVTLEVEAFPTDRLVSLGRL